MKKPMAALTLCVVGLILLTLASNGRRNKVTKKEIEQTPHPKTVVKSEDWSSDWSKNSSSKAISTVATNTKAKKKKADERKSLYYARHIKREDWTKPMSAGTLSKYILWNKPTLKASIADYIKKFKLKLITSS